MAQATQDLVIRMKTDSTNFNEGIEKAKGKIKSFGSDGNNAMGGFTKAIGAASKAFAALGLAVGAKNVFNSFINSTESLSDTFHNEIGAMGDAWKNFLWQVNTANFKGFKDLIQYARDARNAIDALGDAQALFDLSSMDIGTDLQDLLNTIQKKKKKGEDYSEEVKQYNKLLDELKKDMSQQNKKTAESLYNLFAGKGIFLGDYGLGDANSIEGYLELEKLARRAASGEFDDTINKYRKGRDKSELKSVGDFIYNDTDTEKNIQEMVKQYGLMWVNQAKLYSDLADIPTEQKEQIEQILKAYRGNQRALIQYERQLNRYLEQEEKPTTTQNYMPTPSRPTQETIPQLQPKKFSGQIDMSFNGAQPLDDDMVNNWMAQYNYQLEQEQAVIDQLNEQWQNHINQLNEYSYILGNVTNLFSALANIASDGSPWQKFMATLGSVASGIQGLISTYTQLIQIEAVAQAIEAGKGIPFPFNIAMIAAAGVAIIGVIQSLKSQSFANGGIVGGNDYHDGIHANLSSREMVLNQHQQLELWRLITLTNPMAYAQNVRFIIEGENLVGAIDNYNKNSNY